MATFYWTIQLDSITPPSALEVGLGQDGTGAQLPAAQTGNVVDTGQASPLDGAVATGLIRGTRYLVSWIWDDALGDLRGPVSLSFLTDATYFLINATAQPGSVTGGTLQPQIDVEVT